MRKKIATGSVFQRTYRDRHGRLLKTAAWHLKYYVKGKVVQVPSGTDDYHEALGMLRKRMAEATTRENYSDQPERVRMDQLFDLLVDDYTFNERKSTSDTELRVDRHLRPFFGAMKGQAIGTSTRRQYVELRRRQHAAIKNSDCPFLIQDQGQLVFDFEKAWATACDLAGVPDALFHDLRRTALTNMIETTVVTDSRGGPIEVL